MPVGSIVTSQASWFRYRKRRSVPIESASTTSVGPPTPENVHIYFILWSRLKILYSSVLVSWPYVYTCVSLPLSCAYQLFGLIWLYEITRAQFHVCSGYSKPKINWRQRAASATSWVRESKIKRDKSEIERVSISRLRISDSCFSCSFHALVCREVYIRERSILIVEEERIADLGGLETWQSKARARSHDAFACFFFHFLSVSASCALAVRNSNRASSVPTISRWKCLNGTSIVRARYQSQTLLSPLLCSQLQFFFITVPRKYFNSPRRETGVRRFRLEKIKRKEIIVIFFYLFAGSSDKLWARTEVTDEFF